MADTTVEGFGNSGRQKITDTTAERFQLMQTPWMRTPCMVDELSIYKDPRNISDRLKLRYRDMPFQLSPLNLRLRRGAEDQKRDPSRTSGSLAA